LGRENVSITVGEDSEIVSLDVHEGEENVFPAVDEKELEIFLETVFVNGVGCIDGR
jgi:hypothetical protein